ncbi:MAG: lipoyl(octanoyl) transferase LipB [Actinomycetota bacterium]
MTGWLIRHERPVAYGDAFAEMHDLADRRLKGEAPDTLLLLEHPPVFTAGRRSKPEHLLWNETDLRERGATVVEADRGGSFTFHGPGQLVGYPILDLGASPDVPSYLRNLEEVVIRAAADLGVELNRNPMQTGVWAGDQKVCAIGIKLMRARITLHGFAINCDTDLAWFQGIVACGLPDAGVASLSRLAGRKITVGETAGPIATRFQEVFGVNLFAPRWELGAPGLAV